MLVEKWDNRTNFPKFTRDDNEPRGPKRFTTTLKIPAGVARPVHYEDHEAPWSVVARNIDLNIGNLPQYHGTATFSGGTVAIQDNVPFWANMKATLHASTARSSTSITSSSTPTARKTVATGDVDLGHWPEQTYEFKSRVQFARMRQLFFKDEKWELSGDGRFHRHIPSVQGWPRSRPARLRASCWASTSTGSRRSTGRCTGRRRCSTSATPVRRFSAATRDSRIRFSRSAPPSGRPHGSKRASTGVDLAAFTEFQKLTGLRFAGRAAGEDVVLEWPLGRFAERSGSGHLTVTPPAGVQPMTASLRRRRRRSRHFTSGARLRRLRFRRICRSPAS